MLCITACGIEDYPYLAQIPPSNVNRPSHTTATVAINTRSDTEPFLNYAIFYRIYISDILLTSTIGESELSFINATLNSDYLAIKPYTDPANNLTTNTGSLFSGRNHFEIGITEGDINDLLLNSKNSFTLQLDFSDTLTQAPRIFRAGGGELTLKRSTGSGGFNPRPLYDDGTFDGRFINTPELNASANTTSTINRDVVDKNITGGMPRYTYAALYICAVGVNDTTLVPLYSAPTYIGTFLLPQKFDP
ncbi:MAG: hypothetical protein LBG74_06640 [Spirochaetaceae bacterium]|nr:hypothetical protein [Spirochaetaceae bacterium]